MWLLAFAALFFLVVSYLAFRFHLVSIEKIIAWVELARTHRWLILLFYLGFVLGVMGLPITLFPIIGGVLLDFRWALPLNLFSATMGAWASYKVSRLFGRTTVESILKGKTKMLDRLTGQQGFKSVFFLRLIGIPPFIVSNYALGLSAVRSRDFLLGTLFGILPWMTLVTYASHSLWEAVKLGGTLGLKRAMWNLMAPLFIISGVMLVSTLAATFLKNRHAKKTITDHSNL